MAEKKAMPVRTKTASSPSSLLTRRLSNPTISRLIAESVSKPQSPMTPSPAGSKELRSILQRLELMEIESRDLLNNLFSLVQTDARLERYIRKRLADPKVSRIWELVEQILASQQCKLDIEKMLNDVDGLNNDFNGVSDFHCGDYSTIDKGLKVSDDGDDGVRIERFKVRSFDINEVVVAQPYIPTGIKNVLIN